MDTINKGVELMLRPRRKVPKSNPKTFLIRFEKVISFLRKEITIYFEFSFDVRNRIRGED